MLICESCNENYATTRSTNPDWSGYELCTECAAEYDDRPPVGMGVKGVPHIDPAHRAATYKQQLSYLLRRREYRGWTGQITCYGYHPYQPSRREVVAELFGPNGEVKGVHLLHADGRLALGRD